ncbi:homeobox-leucine zipper protein ROC7-like [Lycium barbarum]|uniref:homeobox-leucine zipper protein ROC7-like n=1 Tax=Lycium barbarum TaxID=112863 RepID=UPI00293F0F36|nr:homeobox-leucine zipper protein ROC7-like [Lycium barbarum]
MNPANQFWSMIENDPGFVSSSSKLPHGQSNSFLKSELNSLDITPKIVSEKDIMLQLGDDEIDIKSSGNDNQEGKSSSETIVTNGQLANRRKLHHRHTQHRIQELEAFFKECPDDKQRKELGHRLGLEPLQVKFWFQNKCTQIKNKGQHNDNASLRVENDKPRAENVRLGEALDNGCAHCGHPRLNLGEMSYDRHHLRLGNAHLQQEHERMSEIEKSSIIEVAVEAMEELLQMARMGEPLWLSSIYNETIFLNEEEYMKRFHRGSGRKAQEIKTEASRENAIVIMNHIHLVEILMDTNHWASLFSNIVSTAVTLDVISTGVAGNLNGAMQKIYAEFQMPSPQVPTRECYFLRYCKRTVDGIWAIVDVSLDHTPTTSCRKRPSGCLIQKMPNGYSKVTWIEHVEVDDVVIHNIYKPLVTSGLAFGAKRWIVTLNRQCERLASAMAINLHKNDICQMLSTDKEGRKGVLKLADRMVISYCSGVSSSTTHNWTTLTGSGSDINDVRMMTRQSIDDPGRPHGIVLSASTSLWLPIPPKTVFDFLRDENTRSKWDVLSNGGNVQEVAHIANGRETGNCVSVLRVNSLNSAQSNMLIVQESSTDPTGSFVVYAPVDVSAVNIVLCGGNSDNVALLPSGFVILADGPSESSVGSLLTTAFQILVDHVPTAKISPSSVAMVNNLVSCTINKIRAALLSDTL